MNPTCDDVRTSLSAHVDGEDGALSIEVVDHHVVACVECTNYAAGITLLDERVAAFRAIPVEDRTAAVLSAAGSERRAADSVATHGQLRGLLGLAAAVQLVLAVSALFGVGGDHIARDLAVFELAAAGGLAAAAWRPHLAPGLLPVIGLAAVIGIVTMVADTVAGTSSIAAEFAHFVLVVATWPLAVLAREEGLGGTVQHR